jgi:membrane-bound serine protease (ClpP class)
MKYLLYGLYIFVIGVFSGLEPVGARHADWIVINGAINPVTARYIDDTVSRAEDQGSECLVIELDTPGGLLESTWTIDKRLLSAKIPVIVYVSPSGGRAASAGVFIAYASNWIAMAPGTHLGAAHPVSMIPLGNDTTKAMTDKVVNDAVAHIKSLAEQRGRNAVWAENAVRNSVSITEKEAIEEGVIDFIADNPEDLLKKLNGRKAVIEGRTVILNTVSIEIEEHHMDLRHRILNQIADPNIAFILLVLAALGIYFEFAHPGSVFPGVIGVLCAVLFLFASQILSINTTGILLIVLAIAFFIIEVYTPTFGVLFVGGVVSFIVGALMLFKSPEVRVSIQLFIPILVLFSGFVLLVLVLAVRTRLSKPTTGKQGLIGEKGVTLSSIKGEGQVSVHGEVWKAVCDETLIKGQRVRVVDVDGLTLRVERV